MKIVKFKLLWFVCVFVAFAMLMPCLSFGINANAANFKGDFVCISYEVSKENEVIWSLDFGLNTQARGLEEGEEADYRVAIQLMVQKIRDEKEASIIATYNNSDKTQFNPSECVAWTVVVCDLKSDSVGFKIKYSSIEAYNFYNGKDTDFFKSSTNFLFKKQIKRNVFPFAEKVGKGDSTITLAQDYRTRFISACSTLSIADKIMIYNPDFIYDYATSSNKIRSNADLVYTDKVGNIHHAWGENAHNSTEDKIMSLSLTTANRGWWYLLGAGIPLIVMTIAIIMIKIKGQSTKVKLKNEDQKTA